MCTSLVVILLQRRWVILYSRKVIYTYLERQRGTGCIRHRGYRAYVIEATVPLSTAAGVCARRACIADETNLLYKQNHLAWRNPLGVDSGSIRDNTRGKDRSTWSTMLVTTDDTSWGSCVQFSGQLVGNFLAGRGGCEEIREYSRI